MTRVICENSPQTHWSICACLCTVRCVEETSRQLSPSIGRRQGVEEANSKGGKESRRQVDRFAQERAEEARSRGGKELRRQVSRRQGVEEASRQRRQGLEETKSRGRTFQELATRTFQELEGKLATRTFQEHCRSQPGLWHD